MVLFLGSLGCWVFLEVLDFKVLLVFLERKEKKVILRMEF